LTFHECYLLPYNWSKYVAFVLVLTPFVWMKVTPAWNKMQRDIQSRKEDAKPIFADPELDRIAKAIRDGQLEAVKEMVEIAGGLGKV
jgi:hypothetical protein